MLIIRVEEDRVFACYLQTRKIIKSNRFEDIGCDIMSSTTTTISLASILPLLRSREKKLCRPKEKRPNHPE
jgi:hypothetical protein